MTDLIANAVSIIRGSVDLDDDALFDRFVSGGFEANLAAQLAAFLPMAYARLMLERAGARLPDTYVRESSAGGLQSLPLNPEPVWNASVEFAKAEVAKGISQQDLLAVAGRSAEFDAANQILNAGYALRDCEISPTTVIWRDRPE